MLCQTMNAKTQKNLRPRWREFGVERVWLFGGRARGKAGADSDWDFLVEFSRWNFRLEIPDLRRWPAVLLGCWPGEWSHGDSNPRPPQCH